MEVASFRQAWEGWKMGLTLRRRVRSLVEVCTAIVCVLILTGTAQACGGIFDPCNLTHGGLSPRNIIKQTQKAGQDTVNAVNKAGQDTVNAVNKAGQDVANAVNELQASALTGPALEQAIVSSHNTAINGAMPIPIQIRQQLTGYSSEDSMDRVHYKIGDNGFINLAHLLEQGGAADAVTLIDVVVFRGPTEAADPSIWAHELTHVDQYRDWGVHSFAVQYTRNWHSVEEPAYAKGNGYWNWAQSHIAQNTPSLPPVVPAVTAGGAFCYTPLGRFGPGPIQPLGAPCFIQTARGPVGGQIGQ